MSLDKNRLSEVDIISTAFLYQDCEELRAKFLALQNPRDIADLLDVSYGQLMYHTLKKFRGHRYKEFRIPKKSGQHRIILAPSTPLKIIQRKLSQVLYSVYNPKAPVHGFVVEKSILTNAQQHSGKKYVLNIDLEDFFHSIHFGRVLGMLMKPPYNCPRDVAVTLAKICCHTQSINGSPKSILPQGAPTSPTISNMICSRLDSELRRLAEKNKCFYTRYCDDITFSTNISKMPAEIWIDTIDGNSIHCLGDKITSIIMQNGFKINQKKVRLQHKSSRQEVTGLTVNKFPNVKRKLITEVSSILHMWNKFGFQIAEKKYIERITSEKQGREEFGFSDFKGNPDLREVIRGKINFIGMVKGKEDPVYLTYSNWFYELLRRDN
jgi:RNA-directed DNA polymerase